MNARDSLAFASQLLARTLPLSDGLIPAVILRDYEVPQLWAASRSLHRPAPCAGPSSLLADISDGELDGLLSQLQRDQTSAEAESVLEELLEPELTHQAAMGSNQPDRAADNHELWAEAERLWDAAPSVASGHIVGVQAILTIDTDYNKLINDSSKLAEFKTEIVNEMARALKKPPSAIQITSLRGGSTIVDVFIEESDPARSAALEMQIRSGPLSKQIGRYPVKAVTVSPLSAAPSSHSNLLGDVLGSSTDASAARQLGAVYFAECIVLVHKLADGAEVLWTTVVELQPTDAGVVSIANHLTRCLSRLGLPAPSAHPSAAARAREVLHRAKCSRCAARKDSAAGTELARTPCALPARRGLRRRVPTGAGVGRAPTVERAPV